MMAAPNAGPGPEVPHPNPNPLFQEVPTRVWEVFNEPLRMAASTQDVLAWVRQEEIAQGAAENNGKPKVFIEVIDGVPHECPIVANGGFFKLLMRVEEKEDVPLVFSFRELFLLGFLHNNVWWMFNDAKLEGSGHLHHPEAWRYLNFEGRYARDMMAKVQIGIDELFLIHDTLSNYFSRRVHQRDEVQNALFRVMVVISEAVRFPWWRRELLALIRARGSKVVRKMGIFSFFFNNWSTISKRVLDGRIAFKPDALFPNYLEMLRKISFLLPVER